MSVEQQKVLRVAGAATVLASGGLVAVVPGAAQAANTTVTNEAELVAAIIAANASVGVADTITVSGTITLTQDLGLSSASDIYDELTITGAPGAVIDGAGYGRFYVHASAGALTLSNLTFQNFYYSHYGAVVYAVGVDVTVTNVTFASNESDGGGGAIAWFPDDAGDDLVITGSTFSSNLAYQGGALFLQPYGGTATITNSTFTSNSTVRAGGGDGGGAIFIEDGDGGTVTISNSVFSKNTAAYYGGAIYATGNYNDIVLDTVTFSDNTADGGGGAIEAYELGSLTITDSTFTGNAAGTDGGAIYAGSVYDGFYIIDSTFSNNSAYEYSGAVHGSTTTTITGSTFTGNSSATADAGVMYHSEGYLTIQNSTFAGNTSGDEGGALILSSPYAVLIEQSTFYGNTADTYGGAIWDLGDGDITITNSTIAGNVSGATSGDGGALRVNYRGTFTLENTIVADNTGGEGDPDITTYSDPFSIPGDNNLIGSHDAEITLAGTGNLLGLDPMLNALANNGGNTETMLPKVGSPVFDAGNNAVAPFSTDQRGAARIYKNTIDIGAVEATAEERGESLPPTGSGAERAAWVAALVSGLGAVFTLGASRRRQQQH